MDITSLPFLLTTAPLMLGVVAAAIFVYVVIPKQRRAKAKAATPPPTSQAEPQPSSPEQEEPMPTKRTAKVKQHSLFVIFSHPDVTTDERLAEWLRGKEASYDAIKKVFFIKGKQSSNPITIANAFPPGEIPDLLQGETNEPIRGINLLVKPPRHKHRNQQMYVYVEFAKELNDIFSGNLLDAEQQPASESTYAHIIS